MSLRTALSLTLLLLLAASGCGKNTAGRQTLPFGVMDEPHNAEAVHGSVRLRGWALAESGIQEVRVYVDRSYATSATLGTDRPDVVKAFPAFTNHPDAGWLANLDTSRLTPGAHEIVVQATASSGSTRDIGDVNVTVVKP